MKIPMWVRIRTSDSSAYPYRPVHTYSCDFKPKSFGYLFVAKQTHYEDRISFTRRFVLFGTVDTESIDVKEYAEALTDYLNKHYKSVEFTFEDIKQIDAEVKASLSKQSAAILAKL